MGVWGVLGSHLLDLLPPLHIMFRQDLVPGHNSRVADPPHLPTTTESTPEPCTCPPVGGASTEQPHTQSTTCPPAKQSHTPPLQAPLPCCADACSTEQKRLHSDKPGQRCIYTPCIHAKQHTFWRFRRLSNKSKIYIPIILNEAPSISVGTVSALTGALLQCPRWSMYSTLSSALLVVSGLPEASSWAHSFGALAGALLHSFSALAGALVRALAGAHLRAPAGALLRCISALAGALVSIPAGACTAPLPVHSLTRPRCPRAPSLAHVFPNARCPQCQPPRSCRRSLASLPAPYDFRMLTGAVVERPLCRLAFSALWRGVIAPAGASLQRRCWRTPSAFSALMAQSISALVGALLAAFFLNEDFL